MADFRTLPAVELIRPGTYNPSEGDGQVTLEDLQNIISASQSDLLTPAVIKIGHTDPRMDNPEYDGNPAYGQVHNLTLADDGTLIGDFIHVPPLLAEILPSAYPNRSVEIWWGVQLQDQDGNVVAEFPCVLTAVALLGASLPAVPGLAPVAMSHRAPVTMSVRHKTVATYQHDTTPIPQTGMRAADTHAETRFQEDHMREKLIALLGLSTETNDEDLLAAIENQLGDAETPEADTTNPEGKNVPETPEQKPETPEAPADEPPTADAEIVDFPAPPDRAPLAASAASPSVSVSAEGFQQMSTDLQHAKTELAALKAERDKEHRDQLIKDYVKTGKVFGDQEIAYFRAQLDKNEKATTDFLDQRTGIPTQMLGADNAPEAHFSADDKPTKLANWLKTAPVK